MIYVISDNHWCHANIIKYENRPFSSVDEMDEYMITQWNSVVKDGDIVYHLGDLHLSRDDSKFLKILKRLNGKIILIKGNHDWRSKIKKYSHLLNGVYDNYTLDFEYNDSTYSFYLSHYPCSDWVGKENGTIHLHGHIHSNDYNEEITGKIINVSVEVLDDYKPRPIIDIITNL